ncbi:hypothetical protein GRF29_1536g1253396 [Pseudopithomyces chartarum]|uniref:Uncharacterized protein n=1 Tax=Pseudopithomyces chartarum TaxID=1892770 RepID=A0AAN6LQQ6_9PLEO|nr:hypothetical protein GRF29_1536g1253396 [Pseudopithomyces chartarum]
MENSWPTAGPSNNEADQSSNNSKQLEADIEAFLNDPSTTDLDISPNNAADFEKALDLFFEEDHLHGAPPSPPKDFSHLTFETEALGTAGVRPFPLMSSNIFTKGLRGYAHYQAKPPTDNMAQFFTVLTGETIRTDAVISARFCPTNDNLRNSSMIPMFNDLLAPYDFTQDANDGPYPPLIAAALRTRAYQQNLAIYSPKYGIQPPHPDTMNKLHLDFLEQGPFHFFTEMYTDLFVTMCPNLQFLVIPEPWKDNPLTVPGILEKWAKEHKWELEVKVVEEGQPGIVGKKGGWDEKQAGEWFKLIEDNMRKYG